MSNVDALEHLAGQLRQGATQFSNAAQTLRQQAQRLDWSAQDLTSNVNAWAGTGSENFKTAWQTYHSNTQKSASALDSTSQALTKLAQKIEDNVQQMRAAQAAQEASGWLTFGLVILDVAQLGLDPATDAATVGVAGADVAAEVAVTAAEDAIVEADMEIGAELDGIVVNDVSDAGDIGLEGEGAPTNVTFDNEPFGGEPGGGDNGLPNSASNPNPEFTKGQVNWVQENAHMSPDARAYNDGAPGVRVDPTTGEQGTPALNYKDTSGDLKQVRFDGQDGNVMIDRKLSVTTFPKSQAQALRQSEALSQNGLTGRWEVPTQAEADRALKMFDKLGITNIDVKVVPYP